MLTFPEEIMLLVLDDDSGKMAPVSRYMLNLSLAGAVLMDLALRDRLDCDLESLMVTDPTPTGLDVLDPYLAMIAASGEKRSVRHWLDEVSTSGPEIKDQALASLVKHGILQERDERFLWVFEVRRYPMIGGEEEREVRQRLRDAALTDDIPDPRDIVLICLVDACAIFDLLFSESEIEDSAERIAALKKLDLIGQAVGKAVEELRMQIAMAMARVPG